MAATHTMHYKLLQKTTGCITVHVQTTQDTVAYLSCTF